MLERNSVVDECGSTNDELRALAEKAAAADAPHGIWISARKQTAGKGRLGRTWISEEGNLFLSILLRPREGFTHWGWLPLAVGVGVAKALEHAQPRIGIQLKWPNDIWLKEGELFAKAGGILCEASGSTGPQWVVAGIGLNTSRAPKDASIEQPTAALSVAADPLRPLVIDYVMAEFSALQEYGAASLRESYEALALFRHGTEVEWTSSHHKEHRGHVVGLGESGELLVSEDGITRGLFAEDVRVRRR